MMDIKKIFFGFGLVTTVVLAVACSSIERLINGVPPLIDRLIFSRYEVDPEETLTVTVEMDEGDQPMQYTWEAEAGQFQPPTDQATVTWQAPVTGGLYQISVQVSNEAGSDSRSENIIVRSYVRPVVGILAPDNGVYITQHDRIDVDVSASHDNGIRAVRLFVNNTLRMTLDGHAASEYAFRNILLDEAGATTIRVEAEANITGSTGDDSIHINVEGIVIGKQPVD